MQRRYRGTGRDDSSRWDFTLRLHIDANAGRVDGAFEWESRNGMRSGVEEVSGRVDDDGSFDFAGSTLRNAEGIVRCRYTGTFGDDFDTIEGEWDGDCPSGTFSGRA